jgi:Na+/phosphate symporter
MDTGILCQLLAKQIEATKFQFRGSEIKWLIEPTKEELAIVDDVIKNYDTLEAEYLVEQEKEKEILAEIEKIKSEETLSYRTQAVARIEAKQLEMLNG